MSNYLILFFLIILTNILIFIKLEYFSNKINLFDYPDKKRKLHKQPVPLIGGIIIAINFFFLILFYENFSIYLIKIFYVSLIFFFIGLVDDKYHISPNKKFIINTLILLIFLGFNQNFLVGNFQFFNIQFNLNFFVSFVFSVFCLLIFINAMNLFDGINLQSLVYSILIFSFLFQKNYQNIYFLFILFVLISMIYYNYKSKLFLGDSGIYLLSSFIAFNIIYMHNIEQNIIADEIFLLMMVPGLDMLRLFLERILNKKIHLWRQRTYSSLIAE